MGESLVRWACEFSRYVGPGKGYIDMRNPGVDKFVHQTKVGTITVPHPKKVLGKGLVLAILKQAGLK
jgi:predicted RNA binding protein YcfA (HicA-like mRNA interferase family)